MSDDPGEPDEEESPVYLVFSVEHLAWWKPGGRGYTKRMSEAGRYTRRQAVTISTRAIIGSMAMRDGILPELPVKLADVEEMRDRHYAEYSLRGAPWE